MRSVVYGVAVLAAFGIMTAIATRPLPPASDVPAGAEVTETMVLAVPEMMCQYSCFPAIKKTLEKSPMVDEVTLAAQKKDDEIDNRQVVVTYKPGFDVDRAIQALEAAGFAESAVVSTEAAVQ